MPFSPWLAFRAEADPVLWEQAVADHENWLQRLSELDVEIVLGTRPVIENGQPFNEGFVWTMESGYQPIHRKYYLPNEEYFWEAAWYQCGPKSFEAIDVKGIKIGFLICTELWFLEHARAYGKAGVQILACPRATGLASASKWIAGGRAAATCSGAFCISSNRGGSEPDGFDWGSHAWIVHPEEAEILDVSSSERPFITQTVNLNDSNAAKSSYPRYVLE